MNTASLLVALSLSWGNVDADVAVGPDGRLSVTVEGAGERFALEADEWAPGEEAVEVVDVDFDGLDDLKVRVGVGAYNQTFTFFRYSPENRTLVPVPFLTSLASPVFDPETRIIVSFHKVRAWGDLWEESTYQFGPRGWLPRRQVRVDLDDPSDPESPRVEVVREWDEGLWREVSREVVEGEE